MFDKVFELNFCRTPIQAIGFYITHFIFAFCIGISIAIIVARILPNFSWDSGVTFGTIFASIYVFIIGIKIVSLKKLSSSYYFLVIFSASLAIFGGALLGLIPTAFMTTRKK